MAALTAASWTVAISERHIHHKERVVRGTLALAGVDTYVTGGIPLPAIGLLGMIRNIDRLQVVGQEPGPVSQYVLSYDRINHKLQLFEEEGAAAGGPLPECDTAEVPGPRTWRFEATGW